MSDPITQYLTAVANEIANDPANLGYKNKTPDQQAALMNAPYTIMVPQVQTPRIAQIISQIPFAPNITTTLDVTASQAPVTPAVITQIDQEIGAASVVPG